MSSTIGTRIAGRPLGVMGLLLALGAGSATAQRQRPVPIGVPTTTVRQPITLMATPVGPPPAGVIVTGTPAQAHVAWQPTPGVSGYSVARWKQTDPNCCRAQSPILPASATSWDDLVQWSGTWVYRVTAVYPNNAQGFVDVNYLYPEPQAPTGLKAVQTGEGTVVVSWNSVNGASYYLLGGPPTNRVFQVNGTSATITGVPQGNQTWQVATTYDPGGPNRAGSQFVSTSLNMVVRSGRYRLWVENIRVDQQTADPNNDGAGDEVYVSAYVQMLDRRNGALQQAATLRSAIHGDVSYWPPPARAVFGTASGSGGLKTGDFIPVVGQAPAGGGGWPLFVLWQGLLTDGVDEILVAPVLWESDDQPTAFQKWGPAMQQAIPSLLANPAVTAEGAAPGLNPVLAREFDLSIAGSNMDRPLGSRAAGFAIWMRQWVVVLTREKIEASLTSPNNFGGLQPGVIPVVLTDVYDPQIGLGGSYTVYLRVERIP